MINLFFIIYSFLILSLNIIWIIFLYFGFISSDSELTKHEVFLKNIIFVVFYVFMYSLKFAFLPLLLKIFKKNLYLRYLKSKLKKDKKYWIKLLLAAFVFDYLLLLSFALLVSDKNLLFLVFSPFILMSFFYYIGGGVFLSYLGFILWCYWLKN